MKKRTRLQLRMGVVMTGVVLALLVAGVVYAATSIDTFDTGTQTLAAQSGSTPAYEALDTASAFGGERDAYLEYVSGSGRVNLDVDFGGTSDRFAYTSGDGVTGRAKITWDGDDNDAQNLDPDGLGSTNLTGGGVNDGILVKVVNDDLQAGLRITAYEYNPSTDYSYASVTLPGMSPGERMDIFFPFGAFTNGAGDGVDWTDVGSLMMDLDGTVQASVDVSIDLIEATSVREYGDLPAAYQVNNILSANHIPQGMRLGYNCDAESSYQASSGADGDDTGDYDDEDGVTQQLTPWTPGNLAGVSLVVQGCSASVPCYVNGWIDWNNDGDFNDTVGGASEKIINNISFNSNSGGSFQFFYTPTTFSQSYCYARFRICASSTGCDSPDDTDTNAPNGEVEDYRWYFDPTAVDITSFTATRAGSAVRVEWETANETDLLGFNVWRSKDVSGADAQLNETIIEADHPGTPMGSSYTYVDAGVDAGNTYYYWLEAIETGAPATWLGPVDATLAFRFYLPLLQRN
ncbi:MAG: hypothetical protein JXA14_09050 [Anaerolineae bacterium]|nr:hypothetical protein [Anaerolineae bacterium]